MKRFLGVLAGIVVAVAVIFGLEYLNHALFPWPPFDINDKTAFAAALEAAPMAAKLLIVAGWFLGTLAGGVVAFRICGWPTAGWIVAGFLVIGGLANILIIPHPVWMQIAAFAAPLVGGIVVSGVSRPA